MKNNRFIFTVFALLLLCVSLVLASCNGNGDITTEAPDVTDAPGVTDTPDVTDAPDVTATTEASPDVTTEEITEEVTTSPEVTTEAPVETTKESEVTTEPPHTHSFEIWTVVKAATCTESGSEESVCSCGEKETREIVALGHTDGEWIVDKEATAEEDGSKHQICAVCGITIKTEIIASKPHTPGNWITDKEPTCTEDGSKHQICSDCGVTIKTEAITAKGHTEVVDAAVAATCTESGLTAGEHCSVCNAVVTAQTTVPAKGHTEVIDAASAATCIASGLTEGKHCSVCGKVIKEQQVIPATGHAEGEWITDKEPTYTEAGSKHISCTVCGATVKTETIPVLELPKSDYAVTVTDGYGAPMKNIEVVFSMDGKDSYKAKTDEMGQIFARLVCGEYEIIVEVPEGYCTTLSSYNVSDANPTAEIMIIKATDTPEFVYPGAEETNTVLAGVYNVTVGTFKIPVEKGKIRYLFFAPTEGAIYHVYTDSDKVEVGYYGGSFFVTPTNTGTIDENGVLILEVLHSQVGNKMVIGLTSTSSSVDECTVTIVRASDIELHWEERPWDQYQVSKWEVVKEPTCTEPGEKNLICLDCGEKLATASIPLLEHDGEWIIDKEATADVDGSKHRECTACGIDYMTEIIPALNSNHVPGLWTTDSSVQSSLTITQNRECTECGIVYGTQIIPNDSSEYVLNESVNAADAPLSHKVGVKISGDNSISFSRIPKVEGTMKQVKITVNFSNPLKPTGAVDEIAVVYNEKDGYYHLNTADGPVLYVRLSRSTAYHEALYTIAGTTNVGRYFYDDEGNVLKKESYCDAICAYATLADTANGVVPLDSALVYILKNMGEGGWYEMTSPNSIFKDDGVFVYPHNAWLFAVCYFE